MSNQERDRDPEWFRFHLGAYAKKTRHLTTLQHGAYDLLMFHYYAVGSLPKDDRALATICKMSVGQWRVHRATLAEFFEADWTHRKIENELEFYRSKSDANARNGKKGGLAKAQRNSKQDAEPKPLKSNGAGLANATISPKDAKPAEDEGGSRIFQGGIARIGGESSEPNLLENNKPALANAKTLLHRVLESQSLEESSSSKDARESEPPDGGDDDDDDENLIFRIKEALAGKATLDVVRRGKATVRAWLAKGFDLERDVLPELCDIAKHLNTPLRTISAPRWGEQIAARRDARLAAERDAANRPPPVEMVLVRVETPQWDAWKAYRGGKSLPINQRGEGWLCPSEWPPGVGPAPAAARPPPASAANPNPAVLH